MKIFYLPYNLEFKIRPFFNSFELNSFHFLLFPISTLNYIITVFWIEILFQKLSLVLYSEKGKNKLAVLLFPIASLLLDFQTFDSCCYKAFHFLSFEMLHPSPLFSVHQFLTPPMTKKKVKCMHFMARTYKREAHLSQVGVLSAKDCYMPC